MDWNTMQKEVKAEVQRIGFHYVSDRPLTSHPDDWYLRVVQGFKDNGEHATWLYNASLKGLCEGKYNMDQRTATEDFLTRR